MFHIYINQFNGSCIYNTFLKLKINEDKNFAVSQQQKYFVLPHTSHLLRRENANRRFTLEKLSANIFYFRNMCTNIIQHVLLQMLEWSRIFNVTERLKEGFELKMLVISVLTLFTRRGIMFQCCRSKLKKIELKSNLFIIK